MNYKSGSQHIISSTDDGIVEAIVAVFNNVDEYGDRILYGAFKNSLAGKLPKGVAAHDPKKIVAKTLAAKELAPNDPLLPDSIKHLGGLYVKAQYNLDTQIGREEFSNVKNGYVDEFSIGYIETKSKYTPDGVNELIELELVEWSTVLRGANRETALISAKSSMSFDNDCDLMVTDVSRFISRSKAREDMRKKEGRTFSTSNITRMQTALDTMVSACKDLQAMIESATPQKSGALRTAGHDSAYRIKRLRIIQQRMGVN